jgi:hypothetical protein
MQSMLGSLTRASYEGCVLGIPCFAAYAYKMEGKLVRLSGAFSVKDALEMIGVLRRCLPWLWPGREQQQRPQQSIGKFWLG